MQDNGTERSEGVERRVRLEARTGVMRGLDCAAAGIVGEKLAGKDPWCAGIVRPDVRGAEYGQGAGRVRSG
jgi:hypothetical protein